MPHPSTSGIFHYQGSNISTIHPRRPNFGIVEGAGVERVRREV